MAMIADASFREMEMAMIVDASFREIGNDDNRSCFV